MTPDVPRVGVAPWRRSIGGVGSSPLVGTVVGFLAFTLVWYAVSLWHRLVPTPLEAVDAVARGWTEGRLPQHFEWTLTITLQGFVYAALVGIAIGLALGLITRVRLILADIVYAVSSVPKLVLFPIILVFLGLGRGSEVFFVALSGVFLIIIHTMVGCSDILDIHRKVGAVYGASRSQMLWKVYLPTIAPSLVAGLRLGFSMGLLHAVLAEMSIGTEGLGAQVTLAYRDLNMPSLFGIVLLISLIAIGGNLALYYVEKRLRGGTTQVWASV